MLRSLVGSEMCIRDRISLHLESKRSWASSLFVSAAGYFSSLTVHRPKSMAKFSKSRRLERWPSCLPTSVWLQFFGAVTARRDSSDTVETLFAFRAVNCSVNAPGRMCSACAVAPCPVRTPKGLVVSSNEHVACQPSTHIWRQHEIPSWFQPEGEECTTI